MTCELEKPFLRADFRRAQAMGSRMKYVGRKDFPYFFGVIIGTVFPHIVSAEIILFWIWKL